MVLDSGACVLGIRRGSAKFCQHDTLSVAAKYESKCLDVSITSVKLRVWKTFAATNV